MRSSQKLSYLKNRKAIPRKSNNYLSVINLIIIEGSKIKANLEAGILIDDEENLIFLHTHSVSFSIFFKRKIFYQKYILLICLKIKQYCMHVFNYKNNILKILIFRNLLYEQIIFFFIFLIKDQIK